MARRHELDDSSVQWRDLALAGGAAVALTLLLAVSVALIWAIGRAPGAASSAVPLPAQTPTPRALVFHSATPAPEVAGLLSDMAMVEQSAASPAVSDGAAILEAPDKVAFAKLANRSWRATDAALVNDGANAVAEPWLTLTPLDGAAYVVEAEIRVTRILETVCDQSFGLAAGSPAPGRTYGAGFLFPCGEDPVQARLTETTLWQDGYNADPVLTDAGFDPGEEWHTYRFEVQADELRLIVDGEELLSGDAVIDTDPAAQGQAGIWSQGVGLEVRRVTVSPLAE